MAHRNYRSFVTFIIVTWFHDVFVGCSTACYLLFGDQPPHQLAVTAMDDSNTSGMVGGPDGGAESSPPPPPLHATSSRRHSSSSRSRAEEPMPGYAEALLLIVFCVIVLLPLWSLCGYHLVLISNGETTKERIQHKKAAAAMQESVESPELGPQSEAAAGVIARRGAKEARDAANEMSCFGHWNSVMCKSAPPSQLPPLRGLVREVEATALRRQEEGAAVSRDEAQNWENGPRRSDSGRDLSLEDTTTSNPVRGVPV